MNLFYIVDCPTPSYCGQGNKKLLPGTEELTSTGLLQKLVTSSILGSKFWFILGTTYVPITLFDL